MKMVAWIKKSSCKFSIVYCKDDFLRIEIIYTYVM